jgi:hypothetical protein
MMLAAIRATMDTLKLVVPERSFMPKSPSFLPATNPFLFGLPDSALSSSWIPFLPIVQRPIDAGVAGMWADSPHIHGLPDRELKR